MPVTLARAAAARWTSTSGTPPPPSLPPPRLGFASTSSACSRLAAPAAAATGPSGRASTTMRCVRQRGGRRGSVDARGLLARFAPISLSTPRPALLLSLLRLPVTRARMHAPLQDIEVLKADQLTTRTAPPPTHTFHFQEEARSPRPVHRLPAKPDPPGNPPGHAAPPGGPVL